MSDGYRLKIYSPNQRRQRGRKVLMFTTTFAFLAGWEVVLILALVLILFGAKNLRGIGRGLGEGFFQFRKGFDETAHDLGGSLGGIYGKPAAEAITHDNCTAEFFDPELFPRKIRTKKPKRIRRWQKFWQLIWHSVFKRWRK